MNSNLCLIRHSLRVLKVKAFMKFLEYCCITFLKHSIHQSGLHGVSESISEYKLNFFLYFQLSVKKKNRKTKNKAKFNSYLHSCYRVGTVFYLEIGQCNSEKNIFGENLNNF